MRGLIGDLCIKTYLVNQNPAETCQVFGKNFSGQLYGRLYWLSLVEATRFLLIFSFLRPVRFIYEYKNRHARACLFKYTWY
jgi:hypothetical protein